MYKAIILLVILSLTSCKSDPKQTPVDNPTIIDKAPKFEKSVKTRPLNKAEKVALKENGKPELKGLMKDYKGGEKHSDAYAGRPKVLGFWASWCGPCIKEKPILKQLAEKYPDIQFLSISVDEEQALAQDFFHNRRMEIQPYDYWIGEDDSNPLKWYTLRTLDDGTGNAAIISLPSYILVGADGKIISNDLPWPSSGGMQAYLDKL